MEFLRGVLIGAGSAVLGIAWCYLWLNSHINTLTMLARHEHERAELLSQQVAVLRSRNRELRKAIEDMCKNDWREGDAE